MRDRQQCIECGKQSPVTETNYTLISAQFGWRLTRRRTEKGDFAVEWRCPECWRKHKQRGAADEPASGTHAQVGAHERSSITTEAAPPASRRTSSKPPAPPRKRG